MGEEKDDKKKNLSSADNSAHSSPAKNTEKNNNNPSIKPTPSVTPTYTTTPASYTPSRVNNNGSTGIDYKKIDRIMRELNATDVKPKNNAKELSDADKSIHQKNEQLFDSVYRYHKQRAKDIVNLRREAMTIVLTVMLVLLLVAIITVGVFLYLDKTADFKENFIKVSVDMTNKDIFYEAEVTGDLIPKDVSPGDKFKLNIIARNSENINGDKPGEWLTIYLRFKMTLIINGVDHEDFIYIEPDNEVWERYDAVCESAYPSSPTDPSPVVKEDDGYYYCRLVLWPNDKVTLIDWLRFSEKNITEVVGGNDAVLKVQIEALEAIPSIINNREIWNNAPQHWVEYMVNQFPDTGPHEGEEEEDSNMWLTILLISAVLIIIVALVIISTRKKKDKGKMKDLFKQIKRKK